MLLDRVGLQTWNDRLRAEILNRQETTRTGFQTFASCDRFRLRYDVDHMFNLPTESEGDHVDGALQYRRLRYLGRVKVHFLVYYPTADILQLRRTDLTLSPVGDLGVEISLNFQGLWRIDSGRVGKARGK